MIGVALRFSSRSVRLQAINRAVEEVRMLQQEEGERHIYQRDGLKITKKNGGVIVQDLATGLRILIHLDHEGGLVFTAESDVETLVVDRVIKVGPV
jgi:hypothetical protein